MTRLLSRPGRPTHSYLETYLREINETPLLDAEQERELAYRIQDGDAEARDHLVRANLRLVVNIARNYGGKELCLSDLIEEGNLGLMRAVEGFDPSMNTRFSTYAVYWIRQSIKRAIVNTGKTVRLPSYMVELLNKWRRASAELQDELGRPPEKEEVGQRLGLSKKKIRVIEKAIRICNAGSQAEGPDSSLSLDELLTDGRTRAPGALLEENEDLSQVLGLLDRMDEREAAVLRLRFGLEGREPMTLREVGECLGLTRERVRQIEKDALIKLREGLEDA